MLRFRIINTRSLTRCLEKSIAFIFGEYVVMVSTKDKKI